jgi:hypothetical protein
MQIAPQFDAVARDLDVRLAELGGLSNVTMLLSPSGVVSVCVRGGGRRRG